MQLEEWRALRARGQTATLPSGLEVQLQRVGTLELAEQGRIPQELRPLLDRMIAGGQDKSMTLADFAEYAAVINLVCEACLAGPEGLLVVELPYADRLAIFGWANEVSGKLKIFRAEENKPVDTAFAVGDVRPAAKRVSGSRA